MIKKSKRFHEKKEKCNFMKQMSFKGLIND